MHTERSSQERAGYREGVDLDRDLRLRCDGDRRVAADHDGNVDRFSALACAGEDPGEVVTRVNAQCHTILALHHDAVDAGVDGTTLGIAGKAHPRGDVAARVER